MIDRVSVCLLFSLLQEPRKKTVMRAVENYVAGREFVFETELSRLLVTTADREHAVARLLVLVLRKVIGNRNGTQLLPIVEVSREDVDCLPPLAYEFLSLSLDIAALVPKDAFLSEKGKHKHAVN